MKSSTGAQVVEKTPVRRPLSISWMDLSLAVLLAIVATGLVWRESHALSIGLRAEGASNVWFESDVSRVFFNMSAPHSNQYRSSVHPVFALFSNSVCVPLHKILHLSLNDSADIFLALTAGMWAALMFLVIRALGFDHILAAFAALIGLVSSSGMLFFSVPETYSLASVSILATLALILFTSNTRREWLGQLLASACSLCITVTNWTLGLLLTFRRKSWKNWFQNSANAFVVVAFLWTVQKALTFRAQFFTAVGGEHNFINHVSAAEFMRTVVAFVFHSVIAPAVIQTPDFGIGDSVGPIWKLGLSFQHSRPGSASYWGAAAAILWIGVLICGVIAMLKKRTRFTDAILVYVLFELILHTLYGVETFMYALDWVPILLIVSIYGFQQLRVLRWPAIIVFTALLAINNSQEFHRIATIVQGYQQAHPMAPPTDVQQMTDRPITPWPH